MNSKHHKYCRAHLCQGLEATKEEKCAQLTSIFRCYINTLIMWCNPKIAFQVTYRIKRGTLWLCTAMEMFQTTKQELRGQKEENIEV